jgi:hypothetical protein
MPIVHGVIDFVHGRETAAWEAYFNAASKYKVLGAIVMIASVILAAISSLYSLWLVAILAIIPFLIGREIFVIGINANEIIDHSRAHQSPLNLTEYNSLITKGTILLSCIISSYPDTTTRLHNAYHRVMS